MWSGGAWGWGRALQAEGTAAVKGGKPRGRRSQEGERRPEWLSAEVVGGEGEVVPCRSRM